MIEHCTINELLPIV